MSFRADLRIERQCHEFERAWQAGRPIRIETFLAGTGPEDRTRLLAALLPLEWEYRELHGERPELDEYRHRFPGASELWSPDRFQPAPATRFPELPNYEVVRELGRGGMGLVYLAQDLRLCRPVALKVMLGGALAAPELRRRFLAEAKSVARLRHPNIVQIYEVGETAGAPVLVLEYIDGGTLAQRIKDGRPAPRDGAALMEQLARAVHYAHQHGVIHRDLKPQNVLLTAAPDGPVPKLTDFGLAKTVGTAPGLTRSGELLGTLAYMSPEQFAGRPELTGPRTDVYGLGAILYEFLTGRPPYECDTPAETARRVTGGCIVPPRERDRSIPADLDAVCVCCLQTDPGRRYPTAAALADDLGRWLAGRATVARPLSPPRRVWRAARRRPLAACTALVACAALATAAGVREAAPQRQAARALSAGQPVSLVGATGLPGWHRWRLGPAPLGVSNTVFDGTCSFQAAESSLLELAADPMANRYRLSAEIRQDSAKPDLLPLQSAAVGGNQAGLFFGYRQFMPSGGAEIHQFFAVRFGELWLPSDRKGPDHRHRMQFELVTVERQPGRGACPHTCTLGAARFDPADQLPGPWRRIVIEVSPSGVAVDWHPAPGTTNRVAWCAARDLARERAAALAITGAVPAAVEWLPRAPIGVYALGCALSVRNVLLEPLPE